MVNILFSANDDRWEVYKTALPKALAEAGVNDATVSRDLPPEEVDYIVFAPNGPVKDFSPYKNCKAVLSLWAGVETVVGNATLTQPLCRMVDDGLKQGMVEWVTGHVLRHHLGMDRHVLGQNGEWRPVAPPLAKDRPITILGIGELGMACADALRALNFPVKGWSRSAKTHPGVDCFHGPDGLIEALTGAEGVVLLLPATPATENILNDRTLACLAPGAFILNPGRGPLIDDDALLAALNSGQVGHATLDVFRVEPLPADHPFWAHPRVTVTPHIASETRADTSSQVVAENIRRGETGEPFLFVVDRGAGY